MWPGLSVFFGSQMIAEQNDILHRTFTSTAGRILGLECLRGQVYPESPYMKYTTHMRFYSQSGGHDLVKRDPPPI